MTGSSKSIYVLADSVRWAAADQDAAFEIGFHRATGRAGSAATRGALLGATIFVGVVILIGLRAANTEGEPPDGTPTEITGEVDDTTGFPALHDEETMFPG